MGLDMYLNKRIYVKNWDYMKPKDRHQITVKKNGIVVKHIDPKKVKYIIEEAAYWRKANAIHKWFVDNVQNGQDDCGTYSVSTEQLKELLKTVHKVLAASELVKGKIENGYSFDDKGNRIPNMVDGKYIKDPTVAKKLLPTQSGFFFGSTDYDEYYYQDLVDTEKMLTEALKSAGDSYFEYYSSW